MNEAWTILMGVLIAIVTNWVSTFYEPAKKYKRHILFLLVLLIVISLLFLDATKEIIYKAWESIAPHTTIFIVVGIIINLSCIVWLVIALRQYRTRNLVASSRRRINASQRALAKSLLYRHIYFIAPSLVISLALIIYGFYYVPSVPTNVLAIAPTAVPTAAPVEKFAILVADFDGPETQHFRVTETLFSTLREKLKSYPNVEVKPLGHAISELEGTDVAREEGKKHNASVIIWGWYGLTKTKVPLSLHFEILCPLKCTPNFDSSKRAYPVVELEETTLQSQLADEAAGLSVFAIALERFSREDWNTAIEEFNHILESPKQYMSVANLHELRGTAYFKLNKYRLAADDFEKAIQLEPNNAEYYHMLGLLHLDGTEETNLATDDFTKAIDHAPNNARYYRDRGIGYYTVHQYENALKDLNYAVALYEKDSRITSDKDLQEDFARAHVYIGTVYDILHEDDKAVGHLNKAIQLKPNYVNAFYIRGVIYYHRNNYAQAADDLNNALSMGLDPDRKQSSVALLIAIQESIPISINLSEADRGKWDIGPQK